MVESPLWNKKKALLKMGSKISPKFRGDLSHDASMVAWHIYLNENRKINHSCRQIYQSHGWYGMGVFVETDLTLSSRLRLRPPILTHVAFK